MRTKTWMYRARWLAAVPVLLAAFGLRTVNLDSIPPGWRDDEVIETTVHAQRVLDGEWPLFFPEAEGHEPLYHYASAGWIAVMGRSLWSVRMVSAFFGLLSVAATFRLARQLFGQRVGLIAAALLAVSFWALMYSRTKTRHVGELVFVLLAFSSWWDGVAKSRPRALAASGVWLAAGLYTYFAAAAAPLVVSVSALYVAALCRPAGRRLALNAGLPLAVATVLYAPLFFAMRASGSGAARLGVVGAPLAALLNGNITPALQTTAGTLGMFFTAGDPEALYNLPGRPVFGVLGFVAFMAGVIVAIRRWRRPRYAFILIWLVVGLAPAFVSLPAASFGHAITAQPATYILPALAVHRAALHIARRRQLKSGRAGILLAAIVIAAVAARDLAAYFNAWPRHELVRFLYRAELHAQAKRWRAQPPAASIAIGSNLSIWDERALALEPGAEHIDRRWYRAEWSFVYPGGSLPEQFQLFPSEPAPHSALLQNAAPLLIVEPAREVEAVYPGLFRLRGVSTPSVSGELQVHLFWEVEPGYIPPTPIIGASPQPPPQPYQAFVHLLTADGQLVVGADRFDVDAFTLQPGDRWVQLHLLPIPADLPPGEYRLEAGLYAPASGTRFVTREGRNSVFLGPYNRPGDS